MKDAVTNVTVKRAWILNKILYGRNEHRLSELKEKYPNMKVVTLTRDLRGGHDAHGHGKYKKYALIPLGD